MVRTALTLRWVPRHVLMLILVTTLSLLGRWQWDVSASKRGGLQNLLYSFQWWFMAGMVIYGWWRLLHDEAKPRPASIGAATDQTARVLPVAGVADDAADDVWPTRVSTSIDAQLVTADTEEAEGETDEELARYNEYLAWLNKRAESAR